MADLVNKVQTACPDLDTAANLMSSLLRRLETTYPGLKDKVLTSQQCRCAALVGELGRMRAGWKHQNFPVARALDRAVRVTGYKPKQLVSLDYLPKVSLCKEAFKRSVQKWHLKNKGGRPSKVNSSKWHLLVKEALNVFSTPSSWTCVVGPNRGRRQVQTLCARNATILRSSPALHGKLNMRQFRKIMKKVYPEYRPARKKTDLCDHCHTYARKIRPRTRVHGLMFIALAILKCLQIIHACPSCSETQKRSSLNIFHLLLLFSCLLSQTMQGILQQSKGFHGRDLPRLLGSNAPESQVQEPLCES